MFVEHKEQGEVTEAPAKTRRFSEAMRIGISRTEWMGQGPYISLDGRLACAWGAAAIGYGRDRCYASKLHGGDLGGEHGRAEEAFMEAHGVTIAIANDTALMTRERIADWLESKGF